MGVLINKMNRGEVTPLMHAAVDSELYRAGLAEALNFVLLRYGGVTRAPGSLLVGGTKDDAAAYLIPFEFNRTQVFVIEAGDEYFRFWTASGRIESGGSPVEVVTPYALEDLQNVRFAQDGDTVYLWCEGYRPQLLARSSDTSWTLTEYVAKDGPYLEENETETTLTPSGYGSYTPIMTSATTPSGTVTGTSASAWGVFNGTNVDDVSISGGTSGHVTYHQPGGVKLAIDGYYYVSASDNGDGDYPQEWTVYGSNDGTHWIALDRQQGLTGQAKSEWSHYTFPKSVAFEYIKFSFSGGGGSDGSLTRAGEIRYHVHPDDQTAFNLTASATTGINGGDGFKASDVGRPIRLFCTDGKWRWCSIEEYTSATVVKVKVHGQAFPDLNAVQRWKLGAWSDTTGWPAHGVFIEGRLAQARTPTDPLGVWASVTGDYDNHAVSDPSVDDDALAISINSGRLNDVSWMVEARDLLIGTAGSLRSLGRADTTKVLSPTNILQRAETAEPSADAAPVVVGNTVLFLDVFKQRLFEAAFSYEGGGWQTAEVSVVNEHLFAVGVTKIVFLAHPVPAVVGLRVDGTLVYFVYDQKQKVLGGTPLDYGGFIEDIMSLPGATGSDLWMIVRRTVNGSTKRFIERMAEFHRSATATQVAPVYCACAYIYDGAATDTITGLDAHAGATVGVYADGIDVGDFDVSAGGELVLPSTVSVAVIGQRMDARLRTLRLATGNANGPEALGRPMKVTSAFIDLYETGALKIGSPDKTDTLDVEAELTYAGEAAFPLRTGAFSAPIDGSWRDNGEIVVETDSMYPATVRAITLILDE